MKANYHLILLVFILASCVDQRPIDPKLSERISASMTAEATQGFTGAVLVAKGNHLVFDRAYGSIRGVTMTPHTRFWLSSTAKQFVSAAILKAEEIGLLRLDDTVGSIFPDAPIELSTITIRQLLTHTSGLGQDYGSEQAIDRDEAVASIFSLPVEPSEAIQFRYSNANYQLSAAIIEEVSDISYAEFLQWHLLGPLRLSNTGQTSEDDYGSVAPVAFELPERLKKDQWGSQGIYSTTHDLLMWYRALADGKILSRKNATELFNATVPIGEGAAALGWFEGKNTATGRFLFTRGNDDYGANSLIYAYLDRDFVIIILTHAGQKDEDTSFSRAALAAIERAIWPAN